MKIDRGQIQFREYVSTGTEPWLHLKDCLGNKNIKKKKKKNWRVGKFKTMGINFISLKGKKMRLGEIKAEYNIGDKHSCLQLRL